MLRPATPLSLLLGVAFVLLLLSVISTPIIKAIPLGSFRDATFGVFGYCQSNGCSSVGIGYDVDKILPRDFRSFDLSAGVRGTLSSVLVLHPVAAFLTLVMFVLAAASHAHGPSHSSRYLLVFIIFTLLDFLVCLAAFVVDVLLFVPHMAWGTYIVLAAAVLVLLSGLVSCAMRRTLVSRKSRKKEIAENAEMSGENYYNRGNQAPKADFSTASQPTVPLASGGNGTHDNLPAFTTFETPNKEDQVSDEKIPLTKRTTSERSSTVHAITTDMPNAGEIGGTYGGPNRSASQDRYGAYAHGPPDAYGATRVPSFDRLNRGGRRDTDPAGYRGNRGGGYGLPPMRGRGAYGPSGRGGYGPRGGGRAGYAGYRGAYGPGGMARGARSPPPGYNNMAGQYDRRRPYADPPGPYGGHQPPVSDPSVNLSTTSGNGGYLPYSPDVDLPRAESPPPLPGTASAASTGHAIEMDATPAGPSNFDYHGQIRDGDADAAGLVGLQQGKAPERSETYAGDGTKHEQETYVSPRAAWNQGSGGNSPRAGSPASTQRRPTAELPGRNAPAAGPRNNENYYEDVDPRFDHANHIQTRQQQPPPPVEPDYEEMRLAASGARSPAESEQSNFTSISQRGINPRWNPQPPMPSRGGYGPSPRRPVQPRQDMLLDNPDFQVPGSRPAAASQRGPPGMIPGSAYPAGPI